MAVFQTPPTTQLVLPSTAHLPESERAFVKVRTKILLGDIVAAREQGNGDTLRTGLVMLSRLITEWNYEENGTPVPITVDTLNKLEKVDYEFLDTWINDNLDSQQGGLAAEEKKVYIDILTPSSADDEPTPPPLTGI